jgi:hypothetical protein
MSRLSIRLPNSIQLTPSKTLFCHAETPPFRFAGLYVEEEHASFESSDGRWLSEPSEHALLRGKSRIYTEVLWQRRVGEFYDRGGARDKRRTVTAGEKRRPVTLGEKRRLENGRAQLHGRVSG